MGNLRRFVTALTLVAVLLPVRLGVRPLTARALADEDYFGHRHDVGDWGGDDQGRDHDDQDRGDSDHGDRDRDHDHHRHHHHQHRHHHSGDHDHDGDDGHDHDGDR